MPIDPKLDPRLNQPPRQVTRLTLAQFHALPVHYYHEAAQQYKHRADHQWWLFQPTPNHYNAGTWTDIHITDQGQPPEATLLPLGAPHTDQYHPLYHWNLTADRYVRVPGDQDKSIYQTATGHFCLEDQLPAGPKHEPIPIRYRAALVIPPIQGNPPPEGRHGPAIILAVAIITDTDHYSPHCGHYHLQHYFQAPDPAYIQKGKTIHDLTCP